MTALGSLIFLSACKDTILQNFKKLRRASQGSKWLPVADHICRQLFTEEIENVIFNQPTEIKVTVMLTKHFISDNKAAKKGFKSFLETLSRNSRKRFGNLKHAKVEIRFTRFMFVT